MGCGKTTGQIRKRLSTTSTTKQKVPFSDWILVSDRAKFTIVVVNTSGSGGVETQAFVQFAAVRPDAPDDVINKGSVVSGANSTCSGVLDLSTDGASKMWMRVGVTFGLAAGQSGLGEAEVILECAYDQCWEIVGAGTVALSVTGTGNQFAVATPALPTLNTEKVKAAFIVTGLTANFQSRLATRNGTTSKDELGGWSTTFDAWRGSGEANTGVLSPTVGSDMWVQLGIQYALSSGPAVGNATISYVIIAKRA